MRRRTLLGAAAGLAVAPAVRFAAAAPRAAAEWPRIGLGTWLTFDVSDAGEVAQRGEVLRRFLAAGGRLVDSSPMYGRAEAVMGELLAAQGGPGRVLAATKVWTPFAGQGPAQLDRSLALWRVVPRFEVALVHNLLNWQAHLPLLRRRQEAGQVRWIGISTSHGRAHDEVERLLRNERLDVLQITWNLADTRADRVMRLAADRGVAVVVNRPFDGGDLFGAVRGRALPGWAREAGIATWAQGFLQWVLAHPAVSCAIPATRVPAHLDENMAALRAPPLEPGLARRFAQAVAA